MKEANLFQTAAKCSWLQDSSLGGSTNWCTRRKIQYWSGLDPAAFAISFHSLSMALLLTQLEACSKTVRASFHGHWGLASLRAAASCERFSTTVSIRTKKNDGASMECLF